MKDLEFDSLIDAVSDETGYNLRDYAPVPLKRRILSRMREEKTKSPARFREKLLRDQDCLDRFIQAISARPHGMFHHPGFYGVFQRQVLHRLRTYPFIRIWIAECDDGREAYSMSILLQEEGLLDRTRIYATHLSDAALRKAVAGSYPLASMKKYAVNYSISGGRRVLSEYYTAIGGRAILDPRLRKNIVFAQHNLAVDRSFNEFHLIMCRQGLEHFNPQLQAKVLMLFDQSLPAFGFLGLGDKGGLDPEAGGYQRIDEKYRLYRKIS